MPRAILGAVVVAFLLATFGGGTLSVLAGLFTGDRAYTIVLLLVVLVVVAIVATPVLLAVRVMQARRSSREPRRAERRA